MPQEGARGPGPLNVMRAAIRDPFWHPEGNAL